MAVSTAFLKTFNCKNAVSGFFRETINDKIKRVAVALITSNFRLLYKNTHQSHGYKMVESLKFVVMKSHCEL